MDQVLCPKCLSMEHIFIKSDEENTVTFKCKDCSHVFFVKAENVKKKTSAGIIQTEDQS